MDGKQLKSRAKELMKPYLGIMFVCALIIWSLNYLRIKYDNIFMVILMLFILSPFEIGFQWLTVDIVDGIKVKFTDVFEGFNQYGRVIGFAFINSLLIFGWLLLLVIPGIVKTYSYILAPYILKDNPEMSAIDAISESRVLMDGHKFDLFFIHLSFILWIIGSALTFGILGLYGGPYMYMTTASFYRMIKAKDDCVHIDL